MKPPCFSHTHHKHAAICSAGVVQAQAEVFFFHFISARGLTPLSCPYKGTRLPPLLSATSPALLHSGVSIPVTPRFPPRLTSRRAGFFFCLFFSQPSPPFFCPTPTPHQPSQPLFIRTSETAAVPPIGCYSENRRSVQPMGCRANRVTVTHEAAQLLCRLRPRRICISAVPSPVLAPPLHSSRLHVAPVQTAHEGRFSVNGVASPILCVALMYFHDGTRTAGAGMKPKPFAAHLQTFYAFRSNPRGAVLHRPSSKSGEGKLSVPSPPIISFPRLCAAVSYFLFFFASGWCQCARAAPSPHVTLAISSPRVDRRGLFTQENATSCQSRRKFENTKLQLSRRSRCVIFRLSVRPNLHH